MTLYLPEIERQAPLELERLTGSQVRVLHLPPDSGADLAVEVGADGQRSIFVIEVKNAGTTSQVAAAVTQLQSYLKDKRDYIGVIVVPYMGETGERICKQNGVSWFDLSGNADISAPGLRIRFRGRPNQFKRRGRPKSLFAASGSRIARMFLIDPTKSYLRRELSQAAGVSEGHTGNLVRRYLREGLLEEDDGRRLLCAKPDLLLDTWREGSDFFRHRVLRGHVGVRGAGPELAQTVHDRLHEIGLEPALTGLAAAWTYDPFAMFRLATAYIKRQPSDEDMRRIGFREGERGANVWLVVPEDDGVIDGQLSLEGRAYVHPIQVYIDLKDHPERANEAAESLRKNRPEFAWRGA